MGRSSATMLGRQRSSQRWRPPFAAIPRETTPRATDHHLAASGPDQAKQLSLLRDPTLQANPRNRALSTEIPRRRCITRFATTIIRRSERYADEPITRRHDPEAGGFLGPAYYDRCSGNRPASPRISWPCGSSLPNEHQLVPKASAAMSPLNDLRLFAVATLYGVLEDRLHGEGRQRAYDRSARLYSLWIDHFELA